jgi:hypothetical protein
MPTFSSRPTRTVLLLPILVAGAAVPLAACGSGGGTGTGGSAPTTTSTGTGGAGGATPEASVIVRDHAGRPAVGIDILVHDEAGATTQQTRTDKTGAAVVDLAAGGGVTALWKAAQDSGALEYTALSVVGLARGAEVRLVADPADTAAPPATMDLSFTGIAPLQSSEWDIVVSCREDTMFAEKSFTYSGCRGSGTYDLVAFLSPRDKRIVFPAQAAKPGMSVPFQLDPAKAEDAPQVAVDVAGMPAGTLSLEGRLWANRPEGGRTQLLTQKNPMDPKDTLLQMSRIIVSPGGTFDIELAAHAASSGVHARLPYAEKELPTSTITWSVPALAPVSSIGPITGDSRRPQVPWALEPGGLPSGATRIQLAYTASDSIPAAGPQHAARWTLYAPQAVSGTANFPEIPASFPGFAPSSAQVTVLADHVDVPGKDSLIAAVNAEFDRAAVAWTSNLFSSP